MRPIMAASLFLLVPALAQAEGSWTPLGKNDKMVRSLIAKELNARKIGLNGSARYTMTSVKGEKKFLGGSFYGSTTAIKFTARPRVKVSVGNGKSKWISIGGVKGECTYGSMMCRPPSLSGLKIKPQDQRAPERAPAPGVPLSLF